MLPETDESELLIECLEVDRSGLPTTLPDRSSGSRELVMLPEDLDRLRHFSWTSPLPPFLGTHSRPSYSATSRLPSSLSSDVSVSPDEDIRSEFLRRLDGNGGTSIMVGSCKASPRTAVRIIPDERLLAMLSNDSRRNRDRPRFRLDRRGRTRELFGPMLTSLLRG